MFEQGWFGDCIYGDFDSADPWQFGLRGKDAAGGREIGAERPPARFFFERGVARNREARNEASPHAEPKGAPDLGRQKMSGATPWTIAAEEGMVSDQMDHRSLWTLRRE